MSIQTKLSKTAIVPKCNYFRAHVQIEEKRAIMVGILLIRYKGVEASFGRKLYKFAPYLLSDTVLSC